jgi:hypothetical protein
LLKIYEVTTGKDSPQYATVCVSKGEILVSTGRKDEGKEWLIKALNIYKKLKHPNEQQL